MNKPAVLRSIFYNIRNPAAYSSINNLFKEARKQTNLIQRKDVDEYLSTQFPYTLHRRVVKKVRRNPIVVSCPEELVQADLIDMQSLAEYNNGIKYILTLIDVFSKKAFAYPLKNKGSFEVVGALTKFFNQHFVPEKLQTDAGKEFLNAQVKYLMRNNNVQFYTANNEATKCSVIERFQRTLQSKLYKYFTGVGDNFQYVDVLQDFLDAYNNTIHRSIGMAPNDVSPSNSDTVFSRLYGAPTLRELVTRNEGRKYLKEGDVVRIAKTKSIFSKGYEPNFSDELYVITNVAPASGIRREPMYYLKDKSNRNLKGRYYRQELVRVSPTVSNYYRTSASFVQKPTLRQQHG